MYYKIVPKYYRNYTVLLVKYWINAYYKIKYYCITIISRYENTKIKSEIVHRQLPMWHTCTLITTD